MTISDADHQRRLDAERLLALAEAWIDEHHQALGGPGYTYLTDGDRARLIEAFAAGFAAAKKGTNE